MTLSKEEIFELYVNTAAFGSGYEGIIFLSVEIYNLDTREIFVLWKKIPPTLYKISGFYSL